MSKIPVRASRVTITEQPEGWLLNWGGGDTEHHDTATAALNAVRDRDRIMADADVLVVTTIEWNAHTSVGLTVVRAITGGKR